MESADTQMGLNLKEDGFKINRILVNIFEVIVTKFIIQKGLKDVDKMVCSMVKDSFNIFIWRNRNI